MGKIKAKNKVYLDGFYKLGIFTAFLLLTVFSVWLYSPVIKSHADDSATSQVEVNVNPVLSVLLSTDELNFQIQPSYSSSNSYYSNYINATVYTNNATGYQLFFSSIDNNTDMVSEESEEVIESLTTRNTNLTIPNGKGGVWGYSKTAESNTWNQIPTLATPASLKQTFHPSPASGSTTKLYIGIAANSTLDSGLYSKDVKFSAVVNDYIETSSLTGITNMQEMTTSICSDAPVGAIAVLTDTRDGEEYMIQKFGDNQCWMVHDLRLTGPITIDSSDSDVESEFTLPAPMAAGSSWNEPVDEAVSKPLVNPESTEGLGYNYYAASAGTITSSDAETIASHSICPRGWTLPSQAQINNFLSANDITNNAQGYNTITSPPFNVTITNGYSYYRSANPSFFIGAYWSSGAGFVSSGNSQTKYRRVLWVYHSTYNNSDSYQVSYYLHDSLDPAGIRCVAR